MKHIEKVKRQRVKQKWKEVDLGSNTEKER